MEEIFVSLELDCQKMAEVANDGGRKVYKP
jgi:hypothetical protein